MGIGLGGATMMSVASDCPKAKAICAIDPWLWPHHKDEIGCLDHQKLFVCMTEDYPKQVEVESRGFDTWAHITKYQHHSGKAQAPVIKELQGQAHFNTNDMVILEPLGQYAAYRARLPDSNYIESYLSSAWLSMQFLKSEDICTWPEL